MKKSDKVFYLFTSSLLDLLESDIPLRTGLEVLKDDMLADKNVRLLSEDILRHLSEGLSFSGSIAASSISVPERYISLIASSETGGSIVFALRFIRDVLERKREVEERIKSVSVYPAFVVLIALIGSFLLLSFQSDFLVSVPQNELYGGIADALVVFAAGIAGVAIYVKNAMGEDILHSVFFSLSYLAESGFDFARCIDITIMYAKEDRKILGALLNVKQLITEGVSVGDAFSRQKVFPKEISARFSLAEVHGNTAKVCHGIAQSLDKKDARKRNVCMQLIEPLLIACTGLYILILVETIILPFLTSYGGL